ncbi:MAG: MFS transporter, partial [Halobacillus sp.]
MAKQKVKNRWLIALCAVGIHISIGSVYAWSNFTNPLIEEFGWSSSQVQFTFSLAILFLGLSAAFLGWYVEKYGPRVAGITAAIFFGIGVFGSGFAVNLGSLWALYLFYGVLGGIGLGVGYIA